MNAICSFVSDSNAGYSLGECCLVHRSDRCCLGSQRFFSCTGLWTILKHDGKRPFFCFVHMESWLILYLIPESLIYRYTVCIYIYIFFTEHIPFYIIHDSFLGMLGMLSNHPLLRLLAPSKSLRLRVQCAKFAFSASLVVCQKFWIRGIRGCSELQRKVSWNDLEISFNL